MAQEKEQKVYDFLDALGISYKRYEHPPVYTVEEAEKYWEEIGGTHCKNLFLRDAKGKRHFLVVLEHTKKADLKKLAEQIVSDRLSFASDRRLEKYLGLEAGSVSPFGLINDSQKNVELILDADLKGKEQISFHPNVNTATISLSFNDFERFLKKTGHRVSYIRL
ncbi:MAG: prolyl-tRNA synthetase associated domain-containing protein [Firmicutes bacterium]|nr:prolyl-tRNA synthetase associated domain-containing protein [Bacillota bacterium]